MVLAVAPGAVCGAGAPIASAPHGRHDTFTAPSARPAAAPGHDSARAGLHGRLAVFVLTVAVTSSPPTLGRALFSPIYASPPNTTRFVFLDPHATEFFRDWDKVATDTIALGEVFLHVRPRRGR
jgi:hypothetical protein